MPLGAAVTPSGALRSGHRRPSRSRRVRPDGARRAAVDGPHVLRGASSRAESGGIRSCALLGATVHGLQSTDPDRAREPLGYYHPSGPAGEVVAALAARPKKRAIALVGVGTGALAVLAGPHQHVTLYEIDPAVLRIAEGSGHFTYHANTRPTVETVLGDGRVGLARSGDRYDLIVLDAFSSGNVPLHLLTREAVGVYLDRLAPGGALLFHVSNRYLDLAPVLAAHARDLGLDGWERVHVPEADTADGHVFGSHWVLLTRGGDDLGFHLGSWWRPLTSPGRRRAWTDDLSNVLSAQRWR